MDHKVFGDVVGLHKKGIVDLPGGGGVVVPLDGLPVEGICDLDPLQPLICKNAGPLPIGAGFTDQHFHRHPGL